MHYIWTCPADEFFVALAESGLIRLNNRRRCELCLTGWVFGYALKRYCQSCRRKQLQVITRTAHFTKHCVDCNATIGKDATRCGPCSRRDPNRRSKIAAFRKGAA